MSRPADTSEDAYRCQVQLWRGMTGSRKVALGWERSRHVRATLEAGIRSRHPDYTDDEVHLAAIRRELGDRLFRQAYPESPLFDP